MNRLYQYLSQDAWTNALKTLRNTYVLVLAFWPISVYNDSIEKEIEMPINQKLTLKAHLAIKYAQKQNENWVLTQVARENKEGHGYYPNFVSLPIRHAVRRLEDAGKIRFVHPRTAGSFSRMGYWLKK